MQTWLTDTPTAERFPLYTRGNADEVGPEPFPPLTWSLAWEKGACRGTADGWVHLGAFRPEEFRRPVPEVFGCWGGYFYNQVSVGRVFGVRTPGGSPDAIDEAYFGGNSDIPPYVRRPARRGRRAERGGAGRRFGGVLRRRERAGYADAFFGEGARVGGRAARPRSAVRRGAGGARARGLPAGCARPGTSTPGSWSAPRSALGSVRPSPAPSAAADDAVAVFTSLGGVETAGTAAQVWELSRLVRSLRCADGCFRRGRRGFARSARRVRRPGGGHLHCAASAPCSPSTATAARTSGTSPPTPG